MQYVPEKTLTGGGLAGCDRMTQVEGQLNTAESSMSRLHDRIETIANRLRPVLNIRDENAKKPGAPECVLVPLANRIRTIDNGIQSAVEKLETIINGIEI